MISENKSIKWYHIGHIQRKRIWPLGNFYHSLNIYDAISCLHAFRFSFSLCDRPLFLFSTSNLKSSFKAKLKVTFYAKPSENSPVNSGSLGTMLTFWLQLLTYLLMFLLVSSNIFNFLKTEFMPFIYILISPSKISKFVWLSNKCLLTWRA